MDDSLNQAFGGQRPQAQLEQAWHEEQDRKRFDIIRVKNPATITVKGVEYALPQKDFYQEYETNRHQKIPFNSVIDIPRYIAVRYVEHMKDLIVNLVTQKMHDDYLTERDRKGLPRYTDKATENKETYETDSYPKTNDSTIIAEIYNILWVGLVYEFGRDVPPTNNDPRSGEVDVTPISMKVLDTLNTRRVAEADSPLATFRATPIPPPMTQPVPEQPSGFSAMNEKLSASDVTVE